MKAKYAVIAEDIKNEILSGKWPLNARISTEQALMEQYDVSRQTVRLALDVLVEEGYVHRRRGSGTYVSIAKTTPIRSDAQKIVGVLTPFSDYYVFSQFLKYIEKELSDNGYMMLLRATAGDVAQERAALKDLLSANVAGLIVEGTALPHPNPNLDIYRQFRNNNIPVIFINGHYPELEDSVFVSSDDRDGGYWAVNGLIDKGYNKIGGLFRGDMHGIERYYGCVKALLDRNVPFLLDEFHWFYKMDGQEYISFMMQNGELDRYATLDAIICYNDITAITLYKTFVDCKYSKIPEIISFDNTEALTMSNMPITGITLQVEEISYRTVTKLINMINGKHEESEYVPWGECIAQYRGHWL